MISKYPAYLKYTNYAQLVSEQYDQMMKEVDLRLPQFWNKHDKARYIDVGMNGYDLYYSGPGKKELDAATIRTNFPIRPQCGIYYFEIKVTSKGEDGFICIGFCRAGNKLERLPGWDAHSYAYHADDGHIFDQCGRGKNYGPTFTTGDVVGCGIDYANQTAFFTKNGLFLGVAFKQVDLSEPIYPCVGLRTPGEKVSVNFGQERFVFDIVQYVKEKKAQVIRDVVSKNNKVDQDNMDQLVLNYLVHHGYIEAANALQKNLSYIKRTPYSTFPATSQYTQTRFNIRKLIIEGKIDETIEQLHIVYPGLLDSRPDILFALKAQKFVELIRHSIQHHHHHHHHHYNHFHEEAKGNDHLQNQPLYEEDNTEHQTTATQHPPPVSVPAPGRRLSWAAIAASPTHPTFERRSSNASSIHSLDYFDEEHGYIRKAMNYGQKLQEEYNSNPSYRASLTEISSLLAYPNPTTSPSAHLLNKSARDSLASDVNAAIQSKHKGGVHVFFSNLLLLLVYQHEQQESSLERVFKQVTVTLQQLALTGHGQATLVQTDSA
ncbi:hypothetical protein RMATCC62417_00704 [Rhizopus microsporus]|nr:hypothetical protein RMATCC62417_00704 [Rhizopus microsporus]